MALVYQHRRLDTNEVFYVGVGVSKKRAHQQTGRNKHWYNITNKTAYTVEILQSDLTWEEARLEEVRLIAAYGRRDLGKGPLVNMTDGGDGTVGVIKTAEQRKLLSENSKGRGLGRRLPVEVRAKLSQAAKLRKATEETRRKISQARKLAPTKPVIDTLTGISYASRAEAAAAFGISPKTIDDKIKRGRFQYLQS